MTEELEQLQVENETLKQQNRDLMAIVTHAGDQLDESVDPEVIFDDLKTGLMQYLMGALPPEARLLMMAQVLQESGVLPDDENEQATEAPSDGG